MFQYKNSRYPYKKAVSILLLLTAVIIFVYSFASEAAFSGQASAPVPVFKSIKGGEYEAVFHSVKLSADRTVQEALSIAAERRAAQAAAEQALREQAEREALEAEQFRQNQILLAAIIFCEAGNQPYEGQVAVGAVVLNRVKSRVYPDNIRDVIYDPGQFGPAVTGWYDRVLANQSYTDDALQAAFDALNGANPVGDCLYFDQGNSGYRIGEHYFH